MTLQERYQYVYKYFEQAIPDPKTELNYRTPYELVVAVLLSAQCTDVRVNKITPAFFERFPTVRELAAATVQEVYEYIKSCSYPNNKSKHLVAMAQVVMEQFEGDIPLDFEGLQKLPGIGRKSANVLSAVFSNEPRIAVDTHVHRVANRIGLTKSKTPRQTEEQLLQNVPADMRFKMHHWLVLHGRYVCTARKPKCEKCGLTAVCQHYLDNIS